MTTALTSTDPKHIGPFALAARIDTGGQGIVYLGHGEDGSPAAVKVLAGAWDDDERQRERFARELSAARKVAPFCTAAVLAADMDADVPYIASEFVPGPTLRAAVMEQGPRTGASLDRLAIATVTALAAVHEAGVVHRDLKPGNVILGPDGPRVIDFGIARFTDATRQTTAVTGTPAYMSPEQIRGGTSAASSDMFSWAAVMAYAASGHHTFPGETTMAVIDRVLSGTPDLTGVPDRLLPVLEQCLSKDPADRPTAVDVLDRLIGRTPTAPNTEGATVLERASAAVCQGTARIRVVPLAAQVPQQRGAHPGAFGGAAPWREDTGTAGGTSGEQTGPRWRTGDPPPAYGAAPDPRGPLTETVPPPPSPGRGGRSGARRRSKSALATVGGVAFLGLLGALLIWATGQEAPSQVEPTGSVPSTEPADPVTDPEQEPETGQEQPVEAEEGGPEEPVGEDDTPTEWTPGEPEWTPPAVDCHTDPHAPGCPPAEPDVCDYDPHACEPEGLGGSGTGGGGGHGEGGDGGEGAGTDSHPEGGEGTE